MTATGTIASSAISVAYASGLRISRDASSTDVGDRDVALRRTLLPQPPADVLDAHNRVVDDDGERDGEARERDRVERLAQDVEHERGRDHRHREGDEGDQQVRQWNSSAASASASRMAAMISVSVMLSVASSMKVAGRNTEVSVRMPAEARLELLERAPRRPS